MAFILNSKTAKQIIENENNMIFFESDDEFKLNMWSNVNLVLNGYS